MKTLLPSCYLGPVSYYSALVKAEEPEIEQYEHYIKQTYRNRCKIATANKIMDLIIPIARPSEKVAMKDIKIAYQQDWQKLHWNAIESAYRMSPYFEYFAEDLQPLYEHQETYLIDLNEKLHNKVMELMQIKKDILRNKEYEVTPQNTIDLRNSFSPKEKPIDCKPYYQVFNEKFGFQTDLSILDLLFCEGPEAIFYL